MPREIMKASPLISRDGDFIDVKDTKTIKLKIRTDHAVVECIALFIISLNGKAVCVIARYETNGKAAVNCLRYAKPKFDGNPNADPAYAPTAWLLK